MTEEDFKALKEGDTVTYIGDDHNIYGVKNGAVLTRKESWLDDDNSIAFNYVNSLGSTFHFFSSEDIKG